jgi:hypothetical protein
MTAMTAMVLNTALNPEYVGQTVAVEFAKRSGTQSFIDNVSLVATTNAVPEPGTIVLLITGMLGLVCYAWRKRK